jgi:hypothetical protein
MIAAISRLDLWNLRLDLLSRLGGRIPIEDHSPTFLSPEHDDKHPAFSCSAKTAHRTKAEGRAC